MTNKLITILSIVAVAGVFALGFYFANDTNAPAQNNNTTNDQKNMEEQTQNPIATLKTNMGDIKLELYMDKMPITAGNFIKLAEEDFYDNTKFHRVIEGFMIQGGDPNSKGDDSSIYGRGGPGYTIEDEFVKGLSNTRGTISMANTGQPNSGGSQFFINQADNINLDFDKQPLTSKHPVFGKVIEGMDVVDKIAAVDTGPRDVPVEPVVIEDIIIEK
ncbi:MAG: peptidylprolyl isomerase [Candidatus Spechtbacterales bacterium]|nr:peptidylprolyl isomerase [Candidatus Spechtbacterales bacterium]